MATPLRLWAAVLACSALACARALEMRELGAVMYQPATESALLEFKSVLGNLTSASSSFWGKTWVTKTACSGWFGLKCDSSGNLVELSLPGQRLEGVIPTSFYTITTLTKLDVSNNRLYGRVNKNLAVINQALVYLDLSSNFFTGDFPALWTDPTISYESNSQFTAYYPFPSGHVDLYVNVSYTYFTGYQTISIDNANWNWGAQSQNPGTACIGDPNVFPIKGSVEQSCFQMTTTPSQDYMHPGSCGQNSLPNARDLSACLGFCGSKGIIGLCGNRVGAVCRPVFVSATSNVVLNTSCVYPPVPKSPPPPPVGAKIVAADLQTLQSIIDTGLGKPSSISTLRSQLGKNPACSTLFPQVSCDPAGNVIGLNVAGLALRNTIPLQIAGLARLQSLSLARNTFYGTWPFDLTAQLTNLVSLDLSQNALSGPVPTGFATFPTYVNYTSNYFSGSPSVLDSTGAVFCPEGAMLAANCLSTFSNSPCQGEPQRAPGACNLFCGITVLPSEQGSPPSGACANGAGGVCVPQAKPLGSGKCTGTVPASPPPPAQSGTGFQFPLASSSLTYFKKVYTEKYGTPASVFQNWDGVSPCWKWAGITCDGDRNIVAVDFRGKGLIGPFPGPSIWEDLFWTVPGLFPSASTVKYIDFSNNKLYGLLDPALANAVDLDYLDLSNNFFTGPLPSIIVSNFQYFNIAGNYLVGKPALIGADASAVYCPGIALAGSLDGNCFDKSLTTCPVKVKSAKACGAGGFCVNGASSAKGACSGKTPVCKPQSSTSTKLICARG